jgi:cytochrome P450
LYWNEMIECWVASSAEIVTAILKNPLCGVRPPAEPVPVTLLNSSAATIFRYLVRLNDGKPHHHLKGVISSTLQAMHAESVLAQSRTCARLLSEEMKPESDAGRLAAFAFCLPVYVVGSLLGIVEAHLQQLSLWMSDFVRCLAPGSFPEQIERSKEAAMHMLDLFHAHLRLQETQNTGLHLLVQGTKQAEYPERHSSCQWHWLAFTGV